MVDGWSGHDIGSLIVAVIALLLSAVALWYSEHQASLSRKQVDRQARLSRNQSYLAGFSAEMSETTDTYTPLQTVATFALNVATMRLYSIPCGKASALPFAICQEDAVDKFRKKLRPEDQYLRDLLDQAVKSYDLIVERALLEFRKLIASLLEGGPLDELAPPQLPYVVIPTLAFLVFNHPASKFEGTAHDHYRAAKDFLTSVGELRDPLNGSDHQEWVNREKEKIEQLRLLAQGVLYDEAAKRLEAHLNDMADPDVALAAGGAAAPMPAPMGLVQSQTAGVAADAAGWLQPCQLQ